MKKIIALILAVLTLIPMAVACADMGGPAETTANGSNTQPGGQPAETGVSSKVLPSDLFYNNTETVTFLSLDGDFVRDEIMVDDMDGGTVNDSVYRRDEKIQKLLGVKFESIKLSADNSNPQYNVSEKLRQAADSGEAEFDISVNSTYSTIMYTGEDILVDLTDCEYMDLGGIYWSQGFNQHASIADKQYLATGAISISLLRYMFVTFYNKQLLADSQQENLYDVVDEKRWTLDYQIELSKNMYKDNDGSGTLTEGDIVGFMGSTVLYVDPYWSSCDIRIISKDSDNLLVYDLDVDRLSKTVDKLITLFHDSDAWLDTSSGDNGKQEAMGNLFSGGTVGTTAMRLCSVETDQFTNMEDEYGVIPVPKFDDAQQNYYTYLHDQFTSYGITSVISNDDERVQMCGAILEALAVESYNSVVPAYYEMALKGRYLKDSESWRMLDMIYENVKIDAGVLYTKSLESIHQIPRDMVKNGTNTVASKARGLEMSINKRKLPALLEDLLD